MQTIVSGANLRTANESLLVFCKDHHLNGLLRAAFPQDSFDVTYAEDVLTALRFIMKERPRLIIFDFVMGVRSLPFIRFLQMNVWSGHTLVAVGRFSENNILEFKKIAIMYYEMAMGGKTTMKIFPEIASGDIVRLYEAGILRYYPIHALSAKKSFGSISDFLKKSISVPSFLIPILRAYSKIVDDYPERIGERRRLSMIYAWIGILLGGIDIGLFWFAGKYFLHPITGFMLLILGLFLMASTMLAYKEL